MSRKFAKFLILYYHISMIPNYQLDLAEYIRAYTPPVITIDSVERAPYTYQISVTYFLQKFTCSIDNLGHITAIRSNNNLLLEVFYFRNHNLIKKRLREELSVVLSFYIARKKLLSDFLH